MNAKRIVAVIVVGLATGPGTPISTNASVTLLGNGDFSAGLNGWSIWVERNGESGGPADLSVSAATGALEISGSDYNAGVWQQVPVPTGVALHLDGEWSTSVFMTNRQFAEVLIWDGAFFPVNGTDYRASNTRLLYKNDTFDPTHPFYGGGDHEAGWDGVVSETSPIVNEGPDIGPSAAGMVTILLKAGNTWGRIPHDGPDYGTSPTAVRFDNFVLVPEPAMTVLLSTGLIGLVGKRFARR